jgi:acetyl-CoA C-acetyltransferase
MPQVLVDRTAEAISRGELDIALIGGAEAWKTWQSWRSRGEPAPWTRQHLEARPSELVGEEMPFGNKVEQAAGLLAPVQWYAIFENALRAAAARPTGEHVRFISELWERFNAVAVRNPHAAIRKQYTAEAIRTPGPSNRMIGYPYTKLMNSNNSVDQGAALLMCSVEAAERFGVPADRWVFMHGAAEAIDVLEVTRRQHLHESPAIRACAASALAQAGIAVHDAKYLDLYSCFPSAVQVAAAAIGANLDRPLTVTGGLTFAGGPWNNYVTHAIVTMTSLLREDPSAFGVCTANGGHLSKHAVGVYSCRPPARGLRVERPQREVDALPTRDVVAGAEGRATLESFTVMHDRDGRPDRAFALCLTEDGSRAVATTEREDDMLRLMDDDLAGKPVKLVGGELDLG